MFRLPNYFLHFALICSLLSPSLWGATFFVTQTTDDGSGTVAGTLSKAIVDLNAVVGTESNNIIFNIPSSNPVITLTGSELPTITNNVSMDGSNQNLLGGTVTIDGSLVTNSVSVVLFLSSGSDGSTIKNLTFQNFELTAGTFFVIRIMTDSVTIENCVMQKMKIFNVYLGIATVTDMATNLSVRDCIFTQIESPNFTGIRATSIIDCSNNIFDTIISPIGDFTGVLVFSAGTVDIDVENCNGNIFKNIKAPHSFIGITIFGSVGSVSNSCFQDIEIGVLSTGESSFFSGITVSNSGVATVQQCDNNTFQNICMLENTLALNIFLGISLSSSGQNSLLLTNTCNNNTFQNIRFVDMFTGMSLSSSDTALINECSYNEFLEICAGSLTGINTNNGGVLVLDRCTNNFFELISTSEIFKGIELVSRGSSIQDDSLVKLCSDNTFNTIMAVEEFFGISFVALTDFKPFLLDVCARNIFSCIQAKTFRGINHFSHANKTFLVKTEQYCENFFDKITATGTAAAIIVDTTIPAFGEEQQFSSNQITNVTGKKVVGINVVQPWGGIICANSITDMTARGGMKGDNAYGILLGTSIFDGGSNTVTDVEVYGNIIGLFSVLGRGIGCGVTIAGTNSERNTILNNSIFTINGPAIKYPDNAQTDGTIQLLSAQCEKGKVTISGILSPDTQFFNTDFLLQFFLSPSANPLEAKVLIGESVVAAIAGPTPFSEMILASSFPNLFITATATALPEGSVENNNTSVVSNALSSCSSISAGLCSFIMQPCSMTPTCPIGVTCPTGIIGSSKR